MSGKFSPIFRPLENKNASLPKKFLWGAGTSAAQIEGAANQDGRGESIWDKFSKIPGKIADGSTPTIACDHYNHFEEDVKLMKQLGLPAYRFSTAWPRILPEGSGRVEKKGLDFYKKLVDTLLINDIKPLVTLYHWDLPQKLEEKGGWTNRDTTDHFAQYTDVVTRALGDQVKFWTTLNEPWVSAIKGYVEGIHAPGRKSLSEGLAAAHNLLLAHGKSVPVIRENSADSKVGIVLNLTPGYPLTDTPRDKDALIRFDGQTNRWFLDPLFKGSYPEDILDLYQNHQPDIKDGDFDIIGKPIDYLGVNYYMTWLIKSAKKDPLNIEILTSSPTDKTLLTDMGWPVHPEGLYELLLSLHKEYNIPELYVTENGAAFPDDVKNGKIHDKKRIQYIKEHLKAVAYAANQGVPVNGYLAWSFLDNWEWGEGFSKRFGLVHVDYDTQKRTVKDSGILYQRIIQNNAVEE